MIQILKVIDYWGPPHTACAYLWWPRLRKLAVYEAVPIGTRVAVHYRMDDEVYEEHFNVYPTPSGYPQFVISHD